MVRQIIKWLRWEPSRSSELLLRSLPCSLPPACLSPCSGSNLRVVDRGHCSDPCPLHLFAPKASGMWEQGGQRHSGLCGQREDSDFKVGSVNLKMKNKLRLCFPFEI